MHFLLHLDNSVNCRIKHHGMNCAATVYHETIALFTVQSFCP